MENLSNSYVVGGKLVPVLGWLLSIAATLFAIKIIVTVVYNVYFHPLSKFPGPRSAAATPLPFVRRVLNGRMVNWTRKLHEEYGDIVRIHPDELSFICPEAWHDIYGSHPQLPKPTFGMIKPPNDVHSMGTQINMESHAHQRRIVGNGLSDRTLREQEFILKHYTDHLIQRLHELVKENGDGKSATTDIQRWYTYTTFDTIGDLAFGDSFHSLDRKEEHPWVAAVMKGLKFGIYLTIFHHFPPLKAEWFLPGIFYTKMKEYADFATDRIDKRLERGTDRPDFMKYMIDNSDEKGGMLTRAEIDSNAAFLIFAGSGTSATTSASTTWFLIKNPSRLGRLQKDIRSHFQSFEDINVASAAKIPYLHACIQEALRMHPPAVISIPREVDQPGKTVAGHPVPVGCRVGIPARTANYSTRYFVEPELFQPERWLDDADPKFDADRKDVYEPFLVGPRNCLGRNLAWAEMNLILCKTLWSFDLELAKETKKDWSDQKVWLTYEGAPLYVKISPRAS